MVNYPKNFDPTPEVIHIIQMVGGRIPEDKRKDPSDDRYPRPMIFKKQYNKKDGTGKFWSWSVTIFAKEINYIHGKPETDEDTFGEFTFWIPKEIREQIDVFFNENRYKFYLIRKAEWYEDNKGVKKTKSVYRVASGLRELRESDTSKKDTTPTILPSDKERTSMPEPEIQPKTQHSTTKDSPFKYEGHTVIPFDDDMGDDEIAFEEDLKKIDIPTQIPDKIPNANLNAIIVTLQNIEEDLRIIANCFKEMLDKFSVKIKKVK